MLTDSSDSSAPNFALDPQGLRGTASARRLRQAQHRKQLQKCLVAALLALIVAGALWRALQPRASGFAVQNARNLPFDWNAPTTTDAAGNLVLSSDSGALWQIDANGQTQRYGVATRAGAPPLADAGGGVYVPGLDGTLTALSAPGKTLWTRDLGGALATTPALWRTKNSTILGAGDSNGFVLGLNARDGKTLWKTQLGGPIGNALVATRDGFLVPTLARGIWRGGLVCVDARTGQIKWSFSSGFDSAAGAATPSLDGAGERVFWNNDEGEIACLDAKSGRVWWRHSLATKGSLRVVLRATPVLSGENLIVGGNDGALRCLSASDGKARWSAPLGAPIRALYAAKTGTNPAILAVTENEIVLVNAANGAIIQRDAGVMAWPTPDGNGAILVGAHGEWQRVNW